MYHDDNLPPNYDYLNDVLDEPRNDRRFPDEESDEEDVDFPNDSDF